MWERPRCGSMVDSHGGQPQEGGSSLSANGGLCHGGSVPLGNLITVFPILKFGMKIIIA